MMQVDVSRPRAAGAVGILFLDADGVITPHRSSWQEVGEVLGQTQERTQNLQLYRNDEITFEEWGNMDAKSWAGPPVEPICERARELRLTDGVQTVIKRLQDEGLLVGILSSGIYQLLANVFKRVEPDFIVANKLKTDDQEILTGEVDMQVTESSKPRYIHYFADEYNVPLENTIAVGDTAHDEEKFDTVGLSIGYNLNNGDLHSVVDQSVRAGDFRETECHVRRWLELELRP